MALTFTPQVDLGQTLPDFSLPTVFGRTFKKSDLPLNQPWVFMFICNHCPYIKAIEDRLIQLGKDLKNLGVPVIAICSNDPSDNPEDSLENLARRAQEKSYPFEYLFDENQEFAKKMGAVCTPDYFVYDKSGHLAYRGRLDDNWKNPHLVTRRELFEAVKALHAGEKLSSDQTPSMGCNIKWRKM